MDKNKKLKLAETAATLAGITPEVLDAALTDTAEDSELAYQLLDKIRSHDPSNMLMFGAYCAIKTGIESKEDLPDISKPEDRRDFEAAIAAMMTLIMLGYRIHEQQTATTIDLKAVN